jgi:MoxR-like ATPase
MATQSTTASGMGALDSYFRTLATEQAEQVLAGRKIGGPADRASVRAEVDALAAEMKAALMAGAALGHARPTPVVPSTHFVKTSTAVALGARLKVAESAGKLAILLSGPSGSGKTYVAEQVLAAQGRTVYSAEISDSTTLADLLVRPTVTGPSTLGWSEGPALRAAREGAALILDEFDLASPRLMGGLHSLLDTGRVRLLSGEVVQAAKGFVCILTCNGLRASKGRYSTHQISTALSNRCIFLACDYLTKADELAILARYGTIEQAAIVRDDLEALRVLFEAGTLQHAPSPRMGAAVVAALAAGMSRTEAWGLALLDGLDKAAATEAARCLARAEEHRKNTTTEVTL